MLSMNRFLIAICAVAVIVIVGQTAATDRAEASHIDTSDAWDNPFVKWCFGTSMPSTFQNEYLSAVNKWNNPSNWFLAYSSTCTPGGSPVGVYLSYVSFGSYGGGLLPGVTFTYATSGSLQRAYVYLNSDMNWSTTHPEGALMGSPSNPCAFNCDIETLAIHEIGHTASLMHPSPANCPIPYVLSVMCVDYRVRTALTTHDVDTIQDKYP